MKKDPALPLRDEIHLWVGTSLLSPDMDKASDFLAPEEQRRAWQFRFEPDRWRYLGGILLQRLLLSKYLSCPLGGVLYSRNQWGKPSLDRSHGSTIQFSHSRSHQTALLAVSRESEVGIDLEYERERNGCDLIMKRSFSKEEREFVEKSSSATKAFFEIWARKEAYIKGIGRGLSHPLGKFDVTPGNPVVRDWSADAPEQSWQVHSIELPEDGYGAAIASPLPSHSIELIEISCDELLAELGR